MSSSSVSPTPLTRAQMATERRVSQQRRAAELEVERILAVTLEQIERSAPQLPSIAEIVAAAGISNQTLYRSFPSKNDLLLAVFEQGVLRAEDYLRHRMAAQDDPVEKVLEWTRGLLHQMRDERVARTTRAVIENLSASRIDGPGELELLAPVRGLLQDPLIELGADPVLDRDCVAELSINVMRRHLWLGTHPDQREVDWVCRFILRGLGLQRPDPASLT